MSDPTPGTESLLCERCGYPIDGLKAAQFCPECGKPVEESLPEWRTGSAWQRGAGVRSFLRTSWETLVRPHGVFQQVRMELANRERALLGIHIVLAGLFPAITWAGLHSRDHPGARWWYMRSSGTAGMTSGSAVTMEAFLMPWTATAVVASSIAVMWVVLLLTWIETLGVRFFGRRRGWRVTRPIAWAVCAHASIGWMIGGIVCAAAPWMVMAARPLYDLLSPTVGLRMASTAATWVPIAGFFLGMLVFETLVYVGVRECRYANERRGV